MRDAWCCMTHAHQINSRKENNISTTKNKKQKKNKKKKIMQIYTSCFLKNYEAINLCGKAVYMRQTAKLSLLRQIGGSLQSFPTYITHV